VGIDGSEAKARDTLGYRDFQTLDQALADMREGATEKALTQTAKCSWRAERTTRFPISRAIKAGLPILEAAKKLQK
jgi:hypothetical protein